ncbi:VOC family protein [Streptomyces longispororuber]|uniref:VOC family protein n=1 Tax=Streptomyces longispororuber TaxID=68230 RepID=UPI00210E7F14|nr:VOC family protein [Streptomyces longispororuber]MCQ4206449.1 VOC family protein [Streptomyces longispororuber]
MQIVVTLDCVDTEAQADFWLAALAPLDYQRGFHGPPYLSPGRATPAPTLLLQHVPEPKLGKNRMHLSDHGFRWIVVADPEGSEFCVFDPPNGTDTAR